MCGPGTAHNEGVGIRFMVQGKAGRYRGIGAPPGLIFAGLPGPWAQ
jgi:hypothetical protein